MLAYNNSPSLRQMFINEIKWHEEQDKIGAGLTKYWNEYTQRGCAIGCAVKSLSSKLQDSIEMNDVGGLTGTIYLQNHLGIPNYLWSVLEAIFESTYDETLPYRFASSIKAGADLECVTDNFRWVLNYPWGSRGVDWVALSDSFIAALESIPSSFPGRYAEDLGERALQNA